MSNRKTDDNSPAQSRLRSVYTNNFPNIPAQLGISLAVSIYQAWMAILMRAEERGRSNTHFHNFHKPMGIAPTNHRSCL